MIIIDFISGIIKAVYLKNLSSNVMFLGGIRKIGIFFIVSAANVLDGVLELNGLLRTLTISYFIANEGVSMLENWSLMGLPIPEKLRNTLLQLKDKNS